MKLMIIESPGKVKKLTAILGPGWKVAASVGHVRDLPQKEMGVESPDFKPDYQLTERGREVVAKLKVLAAQADQVFLATDPDREGESISWHLQQCLKLKNPQRVAFNEITESAVKAALVNPRSIDVQRVAAQEARRVLDRLVGYMVSPALSNLSGQRLSAGRVQSPAVRLVVDREREILAFKPTDHFGAKLIFAGAKMKSWDAEWVISPDFVSEDAPYFMDRAAAQRIASKTRTVDVMAFKESKAKRSPPPPFITSSLQQAASVKLDMSPTETMQAAQRLYEQGAITYHRTDNPNVSLDALGDIFAVASALGLEMAEEPRVFKTAEGAQVGHPAICPTHWEVETAGEDEAQQALYQMIRIRAIACQLADATYAVRKVTLRGDLEHDGKPVTFAATGRTLVFDGWLKLLAGDDTDENKDEEAPNPIPDMEVGQSVAVDSGELLEKRTKAPPRFSEASLIKKLDSEGIGRPSTYAAIMENITSRGYVHVEKKYLRPSPSGEFVVDALKGTFDFVDLGYTRQVEKNLDSIATGAAAYGPVILAVYESLQEQLGNMKSSSLPKHICPACGSGLRRLKGPKGLFWGCSAYPNCSETLPDDDGKPGEKKPSPPATDFQCPECGKALIHRQKKGRGGYDFWGCSGFKDGCKTSFENKGGKPSFK